MKLDFSSRRAGEPGTMIDIRRDHLEIVLAILSEHVPRHEVWAFGSRVGRKAKKHSDLDLVIKTGSPLPVNLLARLRDAFSEADLPFKVDLLDWSLVSEDFRRIIEGNFEVVQALPPAEG